MSKSNQANFTNNCNWYSVHWKMSTKTKLQLPFLRSRLSLAISSSSGLGDRSPSSTTLSTTCSTRVSKRSSFLARMWISSSIVDMSLHLRLISRRHDNFCDSFRYREFIFVNHEEAGRGTGSLRNDSPISYLNRINYDWWVLKWILIVDFNGLTGWIFWQF